MMRRACDQCTHHGVTCLWSNTPLLVTHSPRHRPLLLHYKRGSDSTWPQLISGLQRANISSHLHQPSSWLASTSNSCLETAKRNRNRIKITFTYSGTSWPPNTPLPWIPMTMLTLHLSLNRNRKLPRRQKRSARGSLIFTCGWPHSPRVFVQRSTVIAATLQRMTFTIPVSMWSHHQLPWYLLPQSPQCQHPCQDDRTPYQASPAKEATWPQALLKTWTARIPYTATLSDKSQDLFLNSLLRYHCPCKIYALNKIPETFRFYCP